MAVSLFFFYIHTNVYNKTSSNQKPLQTQYGASHPFENKTKIIQSLH